MKLNIARKKKLVHSAKEVYLAYTALDFFKSRSITTESGKQSIFELCQQALKDKKYDQTVLINNVHYKLVLTQGRDNNFSVHLSKAIGASAPAETKKINSYQDQDVLNLLANQQINLQTVPNSDELVVSNRINEQLVIGGAGKIDLYRTHLVTLHNIIEKIEKEEDISNLLVALATGTGKTYVQALWMMTLSLAGQNGIFAVPDKLTKQFAKDLKRLLPDSFVDSMLVLREKEHNSVATAALKSLINKDTSGTIIIGSSEHLLDEYYHEIEQADSEHTFLAFDEQHLIMKAERRRVRLIELSKKKLSMFLTATPNLETYELSGHKPVAIMSSGQKMEAGQGQFPELVSFQARNITDRNNLNTWQFWTGEFWQNLFHGLLLRITNAIQEEQSSAAVSLVDDLLFYHFDKEGETSARWRMQVPSSRKMLCIIDDNETLVNFCNALQYSSWSKRDVYRNGNLVNREDVANFFRIPDAERAVIENDLTRKGAKYHASLKPDELQVSVVNDQLNLAEQVKNTLFHNLIEYVLTDITGLDEIGHNRLRKLNMDEFQQLVLSRFELRTASYYQAKLEKDIDSNGAREISRMLADLSLIMQNMINGQSQSNGFGTQQNKRDLADFIDNWPLYTQLIHKIKRNNWGLCNAFDRYARSHLIMGVMQGMNEAETPVAESRPFAGLECQERRLYDSNGALRKEAKKRKHTSLEVLNDTSTEFTFSPNYLDITEDIADNYFRLGFVGIYVSNKKTEGFSDRNLHTVINIAEETLSNTNSPDAQIQGIGRNRGLDSTIVPAYIHSLGRGQKTVFKLDHLQSNDYYPELFKSQKEYNNQYVKVLGEKVSKQIIDWVHRNLDEDQTINPERLKRQVLKFIALALRELNNKNSHQIKLSRAQLSNVVHYAMQGIDKELDQIKKPYRLSFSLSALSHVLNFFAECYYSIIRIPADFQIFYHSWFGNRDADRATAGQKHPDDVYIKILNNTSFKSIVSNLSSALEFKKWLGKKSDGFKTLINKNITKYLKKETADNYSAHLKLVLEPLLLNMVADSQKARVANALLVFPQSMDYLHMHLPLLAEVFNSKSKKPESAVLSFLQQIPGLGDLELRDIVNYPEKMKLMLAALQETPDVFLRKNPKVSTALAERLTHFIRNDFVEHLSAFLAYPDAVALKNILKKEKNASAFAKHCMEKLSSGLTLTPQDLFAELKSYFKLQNLNTIEDTLKALNSDLKALQKEIENNKFQSLDEDIKDRLVHVLKTDFLPSMVNLYPLEQRARMLEDASDNDKLKKFLAQHGSELLSLEGEDINQLADMVFSHLIEGELPEQINVEEEVEKSLDSITKQLEDIQSAKLQDLVLSKIMSFSSWSLVPQYLYDRAIADMFKGDEFLNAISLLLPFNKWVELKTDIRKNDAALITIARILIDKKLANKPNPSPQEMLSLFNTHLHTHYIAVEPTIAAGKIALEKILDKVMQNPLDSLSPEMKAQFVQVGLNQLLPLLASFIKSDVKKEQFLGLKRTPDLIFDFMVRHQVSLKSLNAVNETQINEEVLKLINQLLPDQSQYEVKDLHHPVEHAMERSKQLEESLGILFLTTVFTSEFFLDLLKNSFNACDFNLLQRALNSEDYINSLARKIYKHGINSLDKESLIGFIKEDASSLQDVEALDDRLQTFHDFISDVKNNSEHHLDRAEISELLTETMAPVLFHKKFIQTIDNVTGFLNERDLTVIFDAFGKEVPDFEARHYLRFIAILRAQDKEALKQEFMYLPGEGQAFDFDDLPAKKMLDTITSLVEEVLDCHCHYNDQDRKGSVMGDHPPKLNSKISPDLSRMIIESGYSDIGAFARKGFYIHGITQGLEAGGEISADSNKHIIKVLQRVQSHILRPLWWSSNASDFGHAFVKGCRDLTQAIVSGWYGFVNGIKMTLNWVTGTKFEISRKNRDSQDFNDTAFDFAERINHLHPMNAEQVKNAACPVDVVTQLEEFVAKRSPGAGFFGGHLGTPVSLSEEQESPGYKFK